MVAAKTTRDDFNLRDFQIRRTDPPVAVKATCCTLTDKRSYTEYLPLPAATMIRIPICISVKWRSTCFNHLHLTSKRAFAYGLKCISIRAISREHDRRNGDQTLRFLGATSSRLSHSEGRCMRHQHTAYPFCLRNSLFACYRLFLSRPALQDRGYVLLGHCEIRTYDTSKPT